MSVTEQIDVLENYLRADNKLKLVLDASGPLGFDLLLELSDARAKAVDDLEQALGQYFEASSKTICSHTSSGNLWIMSQSLREGYAVQITYFGPDEKPSGDMQFKTVQSAMQEMLRATMISTFTNYDGFSFEQFVDGQGDRTSVGNTMGVSA